jgi:hypothetical protein
VQLLGGAREIALTGDGDEIAKLAQIHGLAPDTFLLLRYVAMRQLPEYPQSLP